MGLGSYDVALVLALATIATLWVMSPLKRLGHLQTDAEKAAEQQRERKAPRKR